jgi:small subunit ribosomal protein S4
MNYTGPKIKRSRRLGIAITPKSSRYLETRPAPPGMHGQSRRPSKQSDYGKQLTEKQRLRMQYNLSERQLRNYYKKASGKKGNTADVFIHLLECRLDALVLRAGFARSIFAARQLVNHGHIRVNGEKVDIPSYNVRVGDKIELREKSKKLDTVNFALQNAEFVPYVKVDSEALSAELMEMPKREDIPVICEVSLVVEFYSR